MLRTDTDNFNRFLTSVGLLLLVAALLAPYFFFHDTDVLRISQKELRGLTPAGRGALEARQRRTADLEVPVLVFSGVLALGGLAALWFGGRRLRTAQGKEDEALEREAKRKEVEFQRLSATEVDEKHAAEARESAPEATRPQPRQDEQADGGDQARPPRPGDRELERLTQTRTAIDRIVEALRTTFEAERFDRYEFRPEVRVVGRQNRLQLDGIFRARSREGTDVILELKVVRQSRNLSLLIRQFTDKVISLVTRYRDISGRDARGWLVAVIPQDVEGPSLDERRELEDRLEHSLANQGEGSIVHEDDIENLPGRFRELFEAQA